MTKPAKFLSYGNAPEAIGVLTGDEKTVTTFSTTGDRADLRTAYFYETGASSAGRIGFWAFASGYPVDGYAPDVISWK